MRITIRLLVAVVASAALLAAAATASANNAVPAAVDSQAFFEGGAPTSDGITPQTGFFAAGFLKGSEAYNSSTTTTVVDFTLPTGVTIHTDPECAGLGFNNYCIEIVDNTCADPTAVTVDANTVHFQIACDTGQSFEWIAADDSLLADGTYEVDVQFKVSTYQRVKNGPNMWQIKMPGVFEVPGGIL
jgi:hypothetical protein